MRQIRPFDKSALAIALDECEAALAPYRRRYTDDGANGMMSHITILYPFCDYQAWDDEAARTLSAKVSTVNPFRLTITRLGRFKENGVLYLDPSPSDAIVSLIRSISEVFPDYLPYGGKVALDRIIPHATIAVSPPASDLETVEKEFVELTLPILPEHVVVRDLWLFVKSDEKWRKHSRFSLGKTDADAGFAGNGRNRT